MNENITKPEVADVIIRWDGWVLILDSDQMVIEAESLFESTPEVN